MVLSKETDIGWFIPRLSFIKFTEGHCVHNYLNHFQMSVVKWLNNKVDITMRQIKEPRKNSNDRNEVKVQAHSWQWKPIRQSWLVQWWRAKVCLKYSYILTTWKGKSARDESHLTLSWNFCTGWVGSLFTQTQVAQHCKSLTFLQGE